MPIGNATWGDFTCNSDTEMISDATKAVVGTTCLRTDVGALPGTLYELRALPSNILDNWQPVVSGGGVIATYTVAQLTALAAAGGLVPYATYVASDTRTRYVAASSSALVVADGGRGPRSVLTSQTYYGTKRANLHGRHPTLVPPGENITGISVLFANGEDWVNFPLSATTPATVSISGAVMTVGNLADIGVATNVNGTTLPGQIRRGMYVTGPGVPAGTYVTWSPTDTAWYIDENSRENMVGTYSLNADCGALGTVAVTLSCINGAGGILERIVDNYVGSSVVAGGSTDPDSKMCWKFSIKPEHRLTKAQGRASINSDTMYPRRHYRVEQMFRFGESANGSWQLADYNKTIPGSIQICALEPMNTTEFDRTDSLGKGVQFVTNGPFSVVYNRGSLVAFVRTADEDYALKADDGFWSWDDKDRLYQFYQEFYLHYVKGQEPIKLDYEVFLDERMKSEGGQGWLKCWINQRLVLDHIGPTLFPAGRLSGNVAPTQARFGMYDSQYAADYTLNALCSTKKSTSVERNLHLKYFRVMEIS